jgi:hypothetical protein
MPLYFLFNAHSCHPKFVRMLQKADFLCAVYVINWFQRSYLHGCCRDPTFMDEIKHLNQIFFVSIYVNPFPFNAHFCHPKFVGVTHLVFIICSTTSMDLST